MYYFAGSSFLASSKRQLRRRFGRLIQAVGYTTGLMQLSAHLQGHQGAIILMYHSVADSTLAPWVDPSNHVAADIFSEQMAFLARHRKVISLAQLVAALQEGKTPDNRTVVLTFDDGYLDNLTIAAPILEHYDLPATLFLPTGYIDRGETQWVDQAYSFFRFRDKHQLAWDEDFYDLTDPRQDQAAYRTVCRSLLPAGGEERRALLIELRNQLQPTVIPPRLTMTWAEVRTLLRDHPGFSIGAHTLEHTDLTSVNEAEAASELLACAQKIEAELGIIPRHFSFCYGRTSTNLRQLTEKAGFKAACGGDGLEPVIQSPADLFRLPRVAGPPTMERFALKTSSANTGFWLRLGR